MTATAGKVLVLAASFALAVLIPHGSALSFCFREAGGAYGINPSLLAGIAEVESGMNPRAVNHNGNGSSDYGLMQINSLWLKSLRLSPEELLGDPCLNAMTGARILRTCIDRFGYNWQAVGCYNASSQGKRASYAWKVFRRMQDPEKDRDRERRQERDENQATGPLTASTLLFQVTDMNDLPREKATP